MTGFPRSLTEHVLRPVMIANDFFHKTLGCCDSNRLNIREATAVLESHGFSENGRSLTLGSASLFQDMVDGPALAFMAYWDSIKGVDRCLFLN